MENATTFGLNAKAYHSSRPTYPDAMFQWIAGEATRHDLAWDVGTGSGQAALKLSDHFARIHATDIDPEQIRQAPKHSKITYAQGAAHVSGLPSHSVDAITVATALHWFDHVPFWEEVHRVARKDAIFCAWTYHGAETETDVQDRLVDPVIKILEPYWSEGNRLSWRGYSREELQMPFDPVAVPGFVCSLHWTAPQIAGFVRSWSAYRKAQLDGHSEILAAVEKEALASLGDERRRFILPLHFIAARIR
ncbi:class I SAM-dependent methyltransferase [uncultured Roseovarius sp.]|uniref:class I SAM-dependent methyltransferase n=1 Tax=uncultured Roseovarius sp. TaxID=293344 RepID=UPI002608BB49|nr:class I SAM-dependent methyltransferase [uncultured Roseovarius sp.]